MTPQVTPQVTRLLEVLQGEMTRGEIMKKLSLKDRMHFSKEYLTRAIDGGYIEMTIPDKPNSRFQRYRLTDKGRRVIEGDECLWKPRKATKTIWNHGTHGRHRSILLVFPCIFCIQGRRSGLFDMQK